MRAIIPCAGFGTRMNMKPNESKEMLPDKYEPKNKIIDYSINLCRFIGLNPLVITRKEKTDLIEYCKEEEIETKIIEANTEWAGSVLKSFDKWEEQNILVLPDTQFESQDIIDKMQYDLEIGCNSSIALHMVTDPEKWCVVNRYGLWEKSLLFTGLSHAMGLIAFTIDEGLQLFANLEKNKHYSLQNSSFQYLESFEDITR